MQSLTCVFVDVVNENSAVTKALPEENTKRVVTKALQEKNIKRVVIKASLEESAIKNTINEWIKASLEESAMKNTINGVIKANLDGLMGIRQLAFVAMEKSVFASFWTKEHGKSIVYDSNAAKYAQLNSLPN